MLASVLRLSGLDQRLPWGRRAGRARRDRRSGTLQDYGGFIPAQNLSRKPPSRRPRPIPRFSYIETPSCLVGCAAGRIAPAVRQGACSLPRSSDLAHLRPSSFMPSLLDQYLPLAVFMAVAAVISGALLVAPFLVAFKAPDPEKNFPPMNADLLPSITRACDSTCASIWCRCFSSFSISRSRFCFPGPWPSARSGLSASDR